MRRVSCNAWLELRIPLRSQRAHRKCIAAAAAAAFKARINLARYNFQMHSTAQTRL